MIRAVDISVLINIVSSIVGGAFHTVLEAYSSIHYACAVSVLVTDKNRVNTKLHKALPNLVIRVPRGFQRLSYVAEIFLIFILDLIYVNRCRSGCVVFSKRKIKYRQLNMECKRNIRIGGNCLDILYGVLVPSYLVVSESYACFSVIISGLRTAATVGIHHKEHARKLAALLNSHGVVAVTAASALLEQTIICLCQAIALPAGAPCAFIVVISEHGSPRYFKTFHKIDEILECFATIIKFSVNKVAGYNYQIGLCIFDDLTNVFIATVFLFICCPIFICDGIKAILTARLSGIYYLWICEL